jgi:hypothetical protein
MRNLDMKHTKLLLLLAVLARMLTCGSACLLCFQRRLMAGMQQEYSVPGEALQACTRLGTMYDAAASTLVQAPCSHSPEWSHRAHLL